LLLSSLGILWRDESGRPSERVRHLDSPAEPALWELGSLRQPNPAAEPPPRGEGGREARATEGVGAEYEWVGCEDREELDK